MRVRYNGDATAAHVRCRIGPRVVLCVKWVGCQTRGCMLFFGSASNRNLNQPARPHESWRWSLAGSTVAPKVAPPSRSAPTNAPAAGVRCETPAVHPVRDEVPCLGHDQFPCAGNPPGAAESWLLRQLNNSLE